MSVLVKTITDKSLWQNFLDAQKPHTFLHSWQWGEFQEKMGNRIFRLGIFEDDKLQGVTLVIKIKARRGTFLFCPHGPILDWSRRAHFATLIHYLKEVGQQERVSFIRISPLAEDSKGHELLFREHGFRNAPIHMHAELVSLLDLTSSDEELLANMRKSTRYSIKKAEKEGVQVSVSSNPEDVGRFYGVYERTAERQHFVPFSKEYILKEFEIFAKDNQALLFFGEYQGRVLAAAMIVFAHGSAFYHHGASLGHLELPVAHLIQWEVIKTAKQRGCYLYNFWGIAPEDTSHHPWAGLSLFKKGFGGRSEAYLHTQDLILSPKYWVTYGIERIRRVKRGL